MKNSNKSTVCELMIGVKDEDLC